MVRSEDEPIGSEVRESSRDVARVEAGTVGADENNLIVAKAGYFLGRGFEALGEGRAALFVDVEPAQSHLRVPGSEEVKIRGDFGSIQPAVEKQRPERAGQPAAR